MATSKSGGILAEVHGAARDLHMAGAIDALTMRRFDALCLPPVRRYTAAEIRRIRKRANVSQAVFASVLNVGKATVAAWEREKDKGGKEPSGPALELLDLVERKGLAALA
ncbi:MAG: helix-turn-helix domain-containing protein [Rhodospirillales bacterium]|nr:helix-turn-helix domain-containing protein [Rhodospirillales bacterium]